MAQAPVWNKSSGSCSSCCARARCVASISYCLGSSRLAVHLPSPLHMSPFFLPFSGRGSSILARRGVGALGLVLDWGGGTATGLSPYHGPFIPDVRSCRDFRRPNPNCSRLDSDSLASLLHLSARSPAWTGGKNVTRKAKCHDFFGYFSIRGDSCQGIRDFLGDFMG